MDIPALTNFTPEQLQVFRSSYNYPKAYMRVAEAGEMGDVQLFKDGPMAVFCRPAVAEVTDLWLDHYHQNLLRSEQREHVVLGLASAIYWGFYTFSHGYAVNRINWFLQGHPPHGDSVCPMGAVFCLKTAHDYVNMGNLGQAISSLSGQNQLGRTPFASKIIAFLAPEKSGVYDNRIRNGLNKNPYPLAIRNGVGNVHAPAVQKRYHAWCDYLQKVAEILNERDSWHWSCGSDQKQLWRPLDVERALFAAFHNG